MPATRAFDLALFVGVPANVNDASVVNAAGPPFTTTFKSVALSSKPGGVVVQNDVPAASKAGQIMISGSGAGFPWGLIDNPAAAASVPPPSAQYDVVIADATPAWQHTSLSTFMTLGNAVTTTNGGTFVQTANLVFTATATATKRLDGGDPAFSLLDNFTIDCGTF